MEDLIEIPSMEVVKLNVTDREIARMKDEYMSLTISGIEDKAGYKKVYESRQVVKKTRTGVVKYANELKEKALIWQRKVNGEKDRVVTELEAIEAYLQAQQDEIDAEKDRLLAEEEAKEGARIQARIDTLAGFGYAIDYDIIVGLDDEKFKDVIALAEINHKRDLAIEAEKLRLAEEEKARLKAEREELEKLRAEQAKAQAIIKADQDRIAKEQADKEAAIRAEQARLAKEKADQEAKIRAEEKRIEDERRAAEQKRIHEQQVAKAREEAAEAARLKVIADAKREQEEAAEAERQAKLEAERQASLRPDKEKLQSFSDMLGSLKVPSVTDPAAQEIANSVQILLNKVQEHIIKKIKAL